MEHQVALLPHHRIVDRSPLPTRNEGSPVEKSPLSLEIEDPPRAITNKSRKQENKESESLISGEKAIK